MKISSLFNNDVKDYKISYSRVRSPIVEKIRFLWVSYEEGSKITTILGFKMIEKYLLHYLIIFETSLSTVELVTEHREPLSHGDGLPSNVHHKHAKVSKSLLWN